MTAHDVARNTLNSARHQLSKSFQGMPAELWDRPLTPQGMSPTAMAEHLCEVYVALEKELRGEKHEWGTYQAPATSSSDELLAMMWSLRDQAVEKALGSEHPGALSAAIEYAGLHDAYHVGQLCLLRVEHDPSFNPHSIYEA